MRSEYRITTEICTFFFGYFDSSFMHHGPSFLDNFPWQFSSGCFGFAYNVASIFVWFCRIWLLLLLDLIRFLRLNFLYILTIVDIRTIVFACVPLCGKRERERESELLTLFVTCFVFLIPNEFGCFQLKYSLLISVDISECAHTN